MSEGATGFLGRMGEMLPSLEEIDRSIYRTVAFGFPLLTMVIITGAVWAQYVWQKWWSWDPKETASLVTWLIYGAYLHGRRQRNWKGMTSANFAALGFLAVLFTFAGVNMLNSLHAYGAAKAGPGGRLFGGFSGVDTTEVALTTGFFLAYLFGFLAAMAAAVWKGGAMQRLSVGLAVVGVLANTAVLALRTSQAGRLTFTSGYDFSLWFAWGIALCATVVSLVKRGHGPTLIAALPLALLVCMYAYLYFPQKGHEPLPPALQNKLWLHIHVALAIFAYGALALAAGWGVLYWVKAAAVKRLEGKAGEAAA